MALIQCLHCGKEVQARRRTRKYCSTLCASRHKHDFPKERTCRSCSTPFPVLTRGDANRQYCSRKCSREANRERIRQWQKDHPGQMRIYNATRLEKEPSYWRRKNQQERLTAIELLGGRCLACGETNPLWLEIDYAPTTRGMPLRHPRHLAFLRAHLTEFRLLCANHHRELTLTRRIEGTAITQ